MIISILGNNIKTENIYLITSSKFTRDDSDDEESYIVETIKEKAFWYGFDIKFFNKKSITIELSVYEVKEKEENIPKVDKLREELIKIWSNNQSSIPKLEFES